MAAGGNYNPIASQVPTLFPAGVARALQRTAELPEPSGFAGVAGRTLRPRTSIRAKLNWTEKSARQQQRAGEKKQRACGEPSGLVRQKIDQLGTEKRGAARA